MISSNENKQSGVMLNQSTNKSNFSKVFKNFSDLSDVISLVIHCPEDKTYLVAHDANLDYHIPYIPSTKYSWNLQVQSFVREYIGLMAENSGRLWKTMRFWRSDDEPYLVNVVFEVPVSLETKKKSKVFKLNKLSKTAWVSSSEFDQLCKSTTQAMCPDVAIHIPVCYEATSKLEVFRDCALVQNYNLIEVTREHVINISRSNIFDNLLSSLPLSPADIITLHNEYLKYTYPNVIMGGKALARFSSIVGWNDYLYKTALRGADLTDKGGITFREFLYLICAVDPCSEFKGITMEARNRLIFRCFDTNRDNILAPSEFTALIQAVRTSRAPNVPNVNIDAEVEQTLRAMELRPGSQIPLNSFVRMTGSPKFRYFLNFLRGSVPIMTYITNIRERTISNTGNNRKNNSDNTTKVCKPDYILSSYVSRIHRGYIADIIDIDKMDGIQIKEMKSKLTRTPSADMFRKKSSPQNEVLCYLKYFANPEYSDKNTNESEGNEKTDAKRPVLSKDEFSWGTTNFGDFVQLLIQVCMGVTKIFQSEKRMLILKGPLYIMGDMHGNIQDLCCFERDIWPLGVSLLPCSLLFLGDYVDRGENSIELVAYLFSHKARAPQTVFLVRGNHEIRSTQLQQATYNTFYRECTKRCGLELGKQLWNAVNDAFDCMPLAACIEGKIFCCHGGIPPPWLCPTIQAIQTIPCPLPNPENNGIAWELLWNDPAKESDLSEQAKLEMSSNEGFSTNTKRSTGHIFNEKALDKFFQVNQLSFLIRAHESQKAGFQVHHNWKMLTVFSSSFYAGANKAACVLIQSNAKMKIVQLTTDEYHTDKARPSK